MRHIRVLVLDSHQLVSSVIQGIVEQDQALLTLSAFGPDQDLLREVNQTCPDVIVTQQGYSGSQTLSLIREISRLHPALPIVLIGEDPEDERVHAARSAGAAAYLTLGQVPYELTSLIKRVAPLVAPGLPEDRLDELGVIKALSDSLSFSNLQGSMDHALRLLRQATGAEAGEIFLREERTGLISLAAFDGACRPAFVQITRFRPGEGYPGLVLTQNESIVQRKLAQDSRYLRSEVKEKGFTSCICLPLGNGDGIFGTIDLASQKVGFDVERGLRLMTVAGPLLSGFLASGMQIRQYRDQAITIFPSARPINPTQSNTSGSVSIAGEGNAVVEKLGAEGDLAAQTASAAFLLDGNGKIVSWNEGAQRLLGYSPEEVTGERCWEVIQGTKPSGEPFCGPGCSPLACLRRNAHAGASLVHARARSGQLKLVTLDPVPLRTGPESAKGEVALVLLRSAASAPQATDDALRIYYLGPLQVLKGAREVDWRSWTRKQAVALLSLLAHERGKPVHREVISEALWPGSNPVEAAERIKVIMYGLRQQLEDSGGRYIIRQGPTYALAPDTWLDAVAFEDLLAQGLRLANAGKGEAAARALEAARSMYRGPYLEDVRYAEWALMEKARMEERHIELLRALAKVYESQHRHKDAVALYKTALAQDPCREEIHRQLMRALASSGEQEEARRQFQRCVAVLQRELGVGPSAETQKLFETISAGS